MEFTPEFITENNLTPEQVTAIVTNVSGEIATLKQGWDGKANDNAEGILKGAADYIKTQNNITLEREQGEKMGDYLKRVSDNHFTGKQSTLDAAILDYNSKVENFKGDEEVKSELATQKKTNDTLLQKLAVLEPLAGLDAKYSTLQGEYNNLNLNLAISQVKPTFPETVNKFEAAAKWDAFLGEVNKTYDIKFVDNKAIAVSKENIHLQKDLLSLVEADETLKTLLAGRTQTGPNGTPKDFVEVKEVPFTIPKDATGEQKSKAIREYLASQGVSSTSKEYAAAFRKWNLAIAEGLKAKA
tara:strand:- start:42555 stop:43451 length:897 start_codon:yes stop_codon:yes gene_type:complete